MKPNRLIPVTLCAAACLALGQFAGAQTPDEPASPPFHHRPNLSGMLTHTLDLTDAQKTQVEALIKAIQPQLDAIHQQARTAADAVLKELDTQIRPLLNADQQKKLDAIATLRGIGPHGPE
jgi:Spy/CpxP family protein refolding chaperone